MTKEAAIEAMKQGIYCRNLIFGLTEKASNGKQDGKL